MITRYTFVVNTAELVAETVFEGHLVSRAWHKFPYETGERVAISVKEGDDARDEMFEYFAWGRWWPTGWQSVVIGDLVTKLRLPR